MDDVKDKVKGFMKKVNKPFSSSSSGKFKGQGRVLGTSSAGPANPIFAHPSQTLAPNTGSSSTPRSNPSQKPNQNPKPRSPPPSHPISAPSDHKADGFDPFDPFISSGKRAVNGVSVSVFECPVCGNSFRSEEEVSDHVEDCLSSRVANSEVVSELPNGQVDTESKNELAGCVAAYMSAGPPDGSVEVVRRLLKNIVKEPGNDKFRRIRMSNPKIKEAICERAGGVELLEYVGFRLQEEGEEMWAVMDVPLEDQISLIKEAIKLLEPQQEEDSNSVAPNSDVAPVEKKIDRQVRVFFSVPESVAAKINLPDSFYNLSAQELKREADLRRKKIEESQLLIPKSYKEKQLKAARKRYKATVIRIQFPDGVVLQGVFLPWETTTSLYEFVSSSLKEPCLEFELLQPAMPKRRVIPRFSSAGDGTPTLNEEDLVPSALIKFKPIETDSILFTGLRNELLEISEPLTAATSVVPP